MNIILLSGGSGKRLWPLSNDVRSKQFIKLFKDGNKYESMVQRVYRQITTVDSNAKITIATSKSQASAIKNQLGEKASIFPGREWCKAYAPTVYKYPVLLPFFWVWRLIYKGITNRKKVTQEIKTIKAGKQN